MLDKKRNDVVKIHLKLSQTLKELKTVLPSGFIKTNIFSSSVIPIKHQITLINLRKGKNNKDSNSKELINNTCKNSYLFSEENKNSKKMISNLKNYFVFRKQMKKFHSFKDDKNHSDNEYNNLHITKKSIKKPKEHYDLRYQNLLKNSNKTKSNTKIYNFDDIKLNYELNLSRKDFKSSSIDNSFMKNNICLPPITKRLKSKLSRGERECFGFLLKNFRIDYLNDSDKSNIKRGIDDYKKYKVIKFNKGFNVDIKKKIYNKSKRKEMFLSNSFLRQFKEDAIEIKSIKKLRKEVI